MIIKVGVFLVIFVIIVNVFVCVIILIKVKKIFIWNKWVKIYVDLFIIVLIDLFIEKFVYKKIKINVKIMYISGVKKVKLIKLFIIGLKIIVNNKKMVGKVILNSLLLFFLLNLLFVDFLKLIFLCFVF